MKEGAEMILYERIKNERLKFGWTQQELAEKAGYTNKSMIAKIENGKVDLSQSKISQFADIFNCSEAYLMGWTDNPYKEVIKVNVQSEKLFATPAGMYGAEWDNIDPRISEIEDLYFELSEENKLQFYNAAMLIMKGLK